MLLKLNVKHYSSVRNPHKNQYRSKFMFGWRWSVRVVFNKNEPNKKYILRYIFLYSYILKTNTIFMCCNIDKKKCGTSQGIDLKALKFNVYEQGALINCVFSIHTQLQTYMHENILV